ncbi:RNA directed DNA polymerase [Echinococcus multilocularis]|uniref:RNA directed DNA polymerase n=1 Tax=Echinococcus multilocularis TaxID=6211 RepID=A0A0S4MII9_ECHMU|nr:RNA directed DNA polymerase [Echinococcus multilocularis]
MSNMPILAGIKRSFRFQHDELWTKLFEFCDAAATFQHLMRPALISLFPRHCIIHLDDILVFAGDLQENDTNLKLVLDRLRDAGLTKNLKECHVLQRSVTFLGHTVSLNGNFQTNS